MTSEEPVLARGCPDCGEGLLYSRETLAYECSHGCGFRLTRIRVQFAEARGTVAELFERRMPGTSCLQTELAKVSYGRRAQQRNECRNCGAPLEDSLHRRTPGECFYCGHRASRTASVLLDFASTDMVDGHGLRRSQVRQMKLDRQGRR